MSTVREQLVEGLQTAYGALDHCYTDCTRCRTARLKVTAALARHDAEPEVPAIVVEQREIATLGGAG